MEEGDQEGVALDELPPSKRRKTKGGELESRPSDRLQGRGALNPKVILQPGTPEFQLLAFPPALFNVPLTAYEAIRLPWPPLSGITMSSFEGKANREIAMESGYYRLPQTCREHIGAGGHFCWAGADIAALMEYLEVPDRDTEGVLKYPLPLDELGEIGELLLPFWCKQSMFVSRMADLLTKCREEGAEGEAKFVAEHAKLHKETWPPRERVTGLPPVEATGLGNRQIDAPAPTFTGKLEEHFKTVLLRDFPTGVLLPRHAATWLVKEVEIFQGADPALLFCLYAKGEPSLEKTRTVVQRHRARLLKACLRKCIEEGKIAIPEEEAKQFRINHPLVHFKGNTVEGVNQLLVAKLELRDEKDTLEWKAAEERLFLPSVAAYTASQGELDQWSERFETVDDDGKVFASAHKCSGVIAAEAWAAELRDATGAAPSSTDGSVRCATLQLTVCVALPTSEQVFKEEVSNVRISKTRTHTHTNTYTNIHTLQWKESRIGREELLIRLLHGSKIRTWRWALA